MVRKPPVEAKHFGKHPNWGYLNPVIGLAEIKASDLAYSTETSAAIIERLEKLKVQSPRIFRHTVEELGAALGRATENYPKMIPEIGNPLIARNREVLKYAEAELAKLRYCKYLR